MDNDRLVVDRDTAVTRYYAGSLTDTERLWGENIHFGYLAPGMSPFDHGAMLARMNTEVFRRLRIPAAPTEVRLVDMGCGIGASAFQLAQAHPHARVWGINLTAAHLKRAVALGVERGLTPERVQFLQADYTQTPLQEADVDGAYAVESACYARGDDKRDLLEELHRVLKPGAPFVIADGFVLRRRIENRAFNTIYRKLCDYWSLDCMAEIGSLCAAARSVGFEQVQAEDISWNVLPSLAAVPARSLTGLLTLWTARTAQERRARWQNLAAPSLQTLLAAFPQYVGYFMVSGRKRLTMARRSSR